MQAKLKEVLTKAYSQGYAVGAFNTSDLEITQAIVEAAEELRSPVIVQTSEKAIHYAGLEEISSLVRIEAIKASVPVVLHLDHGTDSELLERALNFGYGGVMVDASLYPEEKRVDFARKVVQTAKKRGISVEGERESLRGKEDFIESNKTVFTDPQKAYEFVQDTGIDAFAPSIGNAHGGYLNGENLNIELLAEINKKLKIPLVLHGASSTPEEEIKEVIKQGICKINIDTDLRHAFTDDIRALLKKDPEIYDPREILKTGKDAIKKVVQEKIRLFDSVNKI